MSASTRVATWNMAYAKPGRFKSHENRRRQWAFLAAAAPDIALLQECRPGDLHTHAPAWFAEEYEIVAVMPQGWMAVAAVLARKALQPLPADRSMLPEAEQRWLGELSGFVATATVQVAGQRMFACSVHALASEVGAAAVTEADHALLRRPALPRAWYNDVAAAAVEPLAGDRFLIGGDWNVALLFDTTDPKHAPAAEQFFAGRAAAGWHDALRKFGSEEQRTYLDPASGPYELDHLFADGYLHDRLTAAHVLSAHPAPQLSDHAMVIADYDLA